MPRTRAKSRSITGKERIHLIDFLRSKKEVIENGEATPAKLMKEFNECWKEWMATPLNVGHVTRCIGELEFAMPRRKPGKPKTKFEPGITQEDAALIATQLLTLMVELDAKPMPEFVELHDRLNHFNLTP